MPRLQPPLGPVALVSCLVVVFSLSLPVQHVAAGSQPARPTYLVEPPKPEVSGLSAAFADIRLGKFGPIMPVVLTTPAPGQLGGPRPGLEWRALVDFYDGKLAFSHRFTAAEGLGPVYNDTACGNCHRSPEIGGGGKDMGDGIFLHGPPETQGDAMGVRKHAIAGHAKEKAHGKQSTLRTPPLFGLGELDDVPSEVINANLDPGDKNGDGIVGLRGKRGGRDGKLRPTRFGQKANEWDLRRFIAGALFDEMGVTSVVRRHALPDSDKVPDPEMPTAFIDRLDAYVRNLARPPRGPLNSQVLAGEKRFDAIGCTGCHKKQLGRVIGAYTDLLLHDMGPALDSGLKDGLATGRHWRTAPLWGLRFRKRFLHDERAESPELALAYHKGEASGPAGRFHNLKANEKAEIVAFLRSL